MGLIVRDLLAKAKVPNQLLAYHTFRDAARYLVGLEHSTGEHPHALPCLMFIDVNMPDTLGIEVLRWIRQQEYLRGMRLVMLSVSNREQDREVSREAGADHYVVKYPSATALDQLVKWSTSEIEAQPP